jgi:hypothetical protein
MPFASRKNRCSFSPNSTADGAALVFIPWYQLAGLLQPFSPSVETMCMIPLPLWSWKKM